MAVFMLAAAVRLICKARAIWSFSQIFFLADQSFGELDEATPNYTVQVEFAKEFD